MQNDGEVIKIESASCTLVREVALTRESNETRKTSTKIVEEYFSASLARVPPKRARKHI
jgi:hypothetical protein